MTQSLIHSELAALIDHTLLKPDASAAEIDRLCEEALEYRFHCVCVHGCRVARAYSRLEDSGILVAAVVGFPLGAMDGDVKRYETEVALDLGADEIDMVLNIGKLKEGDTKAVFREIRDVVEAAEERPVKVILETCALTDAEVVEGCHLAAEAGAKYVKTSTGFGAQGATVKHVRMMREAVGPKIGVKASGGVRDLETVRAMIEAGANRIGTSSGVAILKGLTAIPAGEY